VVYSALPAGICLKAAARRRITHAGRAQIVGEPEGPCEGQKNTLRRSREHERREFAFRPVTGVAGNIFVLMEGFLHPSRCVLTQFRT
jgi:hypothetical protein